jgi:hypothetical protein
MINARFSRKLNQFFAAGVLCMSLSGILNAQVETETSINNGTITKTAKIESGEVIYASGHDLVVKRGDGKIVHFANVPDNAKAYVDGKEIALTDLKPGMKLQRTTVTTITPRTIMTVESISGKVWHTSPPNSVILTTTNGKNERFTLPSDAKITVNGQVTDAWGLKKGMLINATRVTEAPETVISEETKITGTAPATTALAANQPILFAMVVPPSASAADPAPAPANLPATGSLLPLLGLLGFISVGSSLALRVMRPGA